MPRKDGFEACQDMRDIEKAEPSRQPAQIIAVTALSAEEEKKHGQQYVIPFSSPFRTDCDVFGKGLQTQNAS